MSKKLNLNAPLKVAIGELKFDGTLQEIMKIETADINSELERHPSLVAWFGVLTAQAISLAEDAKEYAERKLDIISLKIREELEKTGKKETEAKIKARANTHAEVILVQKEASVLKKQAGILKQIMSAFDHRRDAIVQLSANLRKEAHSEIS